MWSLVFLLKTTSTNTLPPPCAYTPFYFFYGIFCLFVLFCSFTILPHFLNPQNHEWAGLSLVWHHWVFPMHFPQGCSDVRQISLQWACSHCLYSLIDAGMLEVTHESKIRFPCLPLTPHWSHSLCVRLGMKSSSVWSCACTALLCSSFALTHQVLFWNADII